MLWTVKATRYATPLREGGSLPGLVEADDDGLYVVKFRAAGQGLKALIAEVLVGQLARAAGLPVPDIVLVSLDGTLGKTEPDPEINELVTASDGINAGMDFLPGALDYNPARPQTIAPQLASEIVWFDALTTNVDRTARNPNLLVWHRHVWMIDHGAALYQHHRGDDLATHARDAFPLIKDHVLLPMADDITGADDRLSALLTPEAIDGAVADVPDDWLGHDPTTSRDAYRRFLLDRLAPPRPFLSDIEAGHGA
jgi:hypothetical protein